MEMVDLQRERRSSAPAKFKIFNASHSKQDDIFSSVQAFKDYK